MSIRLYVGNLPAELDRQALEKIFNESGDSVSLKVITDRKTGKCRGFGFVTVGSDEVADVVIEKFNGYDFNGAVLKLEKALPRTKGKAEDGSDLEDGSSDDSTQSESESPATSTVAAPVKSASKRKKSVVTTTRKLLELYLVLVLPLKPINLTHVGLLILSD